MNFYNLLLLLVFSTYQSHALYGQSTDLTLTLEDIQIRDPYILTDSITGKYLMYKSKDVLLPSGTKVGGVEVYESNDLKYWQGPKQVFQVPSDYWIHGTVWAPEVHAYKGNYYLFLTLNSDLQWREKEDAWPAYTYRSTQIFKSSSPLGPFEPIIDHSLLPKEWMTLDGTLGIEHGVPYMIYCHEWVQVIDGRMELIRLSDDLSHTIGNPQTLFNASEAKWSTGSLQKNGKRTYVTDGCFLYTTKTGKLLMLWSSFKNGSYAIGIARSVSGSIKGPWIQQEEPLFEKNAGHGMIFKDLKGNLRMVFHGPNSPSGSERALLFSLVDRGDTLQLKED